MAARPIFIGGTASHVGKSWVATALCRYLHRSGYRVAPFKAQNISNNSMACPGGGEIGRAQAAQAEACHLEPHPDMNPILLKPTGRLGSQVVLNGRLWKNLRTAEYGQHFDYLLGQVMEAYARLADDYEYIVVEGAGSVAELNLREFDLVNLGLARRLGAPAILVADIDRGGVFASVIGTIDLLSPAEASQIRSFLVNRFRGDPAFFSDGVRILEDRTRRPCLGVFPYAEGVYLDAEDGVSLDAGTLPEWTPPNGRVAVLKLPHISNFTDFRRIPDPTFVSEWVERDFDVVILPGTKSPIEDMAWLRDRRLDHWILDQYGRGGRIVGVCGGFQMMGREIMDPDGVESPIGTVRGLNILPVTTRLTREKKTRVVSACTPSGIRFRGYEIHVGVTCKEKADAEPFAVLEDGTEDGMRRERAVGTYLHGALEDPRVLEELLGYRVSNSDNTDKNAHYDRLADWFETHLRHNVFGKEYLGQ